MSPRTCNELLSYLKKTIHILLNKNEKYFALLGDSSKYPYTFGFYEVSFATFSLNVKPFICDNTFQRSKTIESFLIDWGVKITLQELLNKIRCVRGENGLKFIEKETN